MSSDFDGMMGNDQDFFCVSDDVDNDDLKDAPEVEYEWSGAEPLVEEELTELPRPRMNARVTVPRRRRGLFSQDAYITIDEMDLRPGPTGHETKVGDATRRAVRALQLGGPMDIRALTQFANSDNKRIYEIVNVLQTLNMIDRQNDVCDMGPQRPCALDMHTIIDNIKALEGEVSLLEQKRNEAMERQIQRRRGMVDG